MWRSLPTRRTLERVSTPTVYAPNEFSLTLLLLALGCASSDPATEKQATGANGTSSTQTSTDASSASTSGPTNTLATGSSGTAAGGAPNAATTPGGGAGSGGSSATNGSTPDAGPSAGGNGGASSTNSSESSSTAGSGAGGTGVIADPGCGSHKWACWPMPNMVGSGLPNEASYTTHEDGTVVDNVTQLMWEDRLTAQSHTWQEAIDFCDQHEFAGFDDWRLPTRIEITSVLDHSDGHTGWAAEAFEAGNSGFHFSASDWILTITQTGAGAGNDYAWAFNMSDGIVSNAYSKSNRTPLKCVRGGGLGEGPSDPAVAPPDQYSVVAEGEVRDNYTGLVWQRGYSDDMLSWQEAVDYCANLDLNGNSWRLPSIRELATLVDEAEVAPAINSEMFPDTKYGARSNDWYWATPERGSAAWGLNFDDGFTGTNTGSAAWNTFGPSWARCVR